MSSINYIKGDATKPQGNFTENSIRIITHCCNDVGAWGAGFVLALSAKWPHVEEAYRDWYKDRLGPQKYRTDFWATRFELGGGELVLTDEAWLWVYNIIGQHGVGRDEFGNPPIRYDAINDGLKNLRKVCLHCKNNRYEDFSLKIKVPSDEVDVSVHMPRMGCGLAGGEWNTIERLVRQNLCDFGIPVTVYDL